MQSLHCSPPGPAISGGAMTITAANGDEIEFEYDGTAYLDPATAQIGDVFTVEGDFDIVGGTGRFDGATGGGEFTAWVVFEGFGDFEWPATWLWTGTISY